MTADVGGPGAPRFDVVLRGYDRKQVDEHVARLQRVLARMRADLEMARSQPLPLVPPPGFGPGPGPPPPPPGPGPRPRPTPRPRGDQGDTIGTFTDRMQNILQAAEEEAAEIRGKARAAARAERESVRAELADLIRQRDALRAEVARMRGQLDAMRSRGGRWAGAALRAAVRPAPYCWPPGPAGSSGFRVPGGDDATGPGPRVVRPQPGMPLPGAPSPGARPFACRPRRSRRSACRLGKPHGGGRPPAPAGGAARRLRTVVRRRPTGRCPLAAVSAPPRGRAALSLAPRGGLASRVPRPVSPARPRPTRVAVRVCPRAPACRAPATRRRNTGPTAHTSARPRARPTCAC